jgi:hypothetical protein
MSISATGRDRTNGIEGDKFVLRKASRAAVETAVAKSKGVGRRGAYVDAPPGAARYSVRGG